MLNKFLNKLERKYRFLGIRNLIGYIVALNFIAFLFIQINPANYHYLILRPDLVMEGQVWRLVTYLFIPPTNSPIFLLIALYLYYMIGTGLEREWGAFKFTLYYLIGAIGTTTAAFLTGAAATSLYLNLSLFLAFAAIYPDFTLYLFFLIPVKMKYLAILNWVILGWTVVSPLTPFSQKLTVLVALGNFFIFFGEDIVKTVRMRCQVKKNRQRFDVKEQTGPIHRCTVCGTTEQDDPNMEFRYCSKCVGDYEYCMDHLRNHEHIK